jgi:hypothetical protein
MRYALGVVLSVSLFGCVGGESEQENVEECGERLVKIDPRLLPDLVLPDAPLDPTAAREWIAKHTPVWHLYNFGKRCEGRVCGNIVLAVPEDSPETQSIRLDEISIARVGGEAFIGDLVARGHVSILDILALERAFQLTPNIGALPFATALLGQPKRERCTECSEEPSLSMPTSHDGVGTGGPTWVGGHERPPGAGAPSGSKGPGWRDPPPPVPESGPDKGISFFGKIRRGLDRALSVFVWNKRECQYAMGAPAVVTAYGTHVCNLGLRAVPQAAVPCAFIVDLNLLTVPIAAWGPTWCDDVFQKKESP